MRNEKVIEFRKVIGIYSTQGFHRVIVELT
jgi:hypothetical protein